ELAQTNDISHPGRSALLVFDQSQKGIEAGSIPLVDLTLDGLETSIIPGCHQVTSRGDASTSHHYHISNIWRIPGGPTLKCQRWRLADTNQFNTAGEACRWLDQCFTGDDNLRQCDLSRVNRRKLLNATNLHQTSQFRVEGSYVSLLKERGLFDCC